METKLAIEIQQKTIKKVFDQRSDFIIIGLTGETDSKLSEVSHIFQKNFEEIALPERKSYDESEDTIEKLEYKIIYDYAKINWKKFDVIKARDIIISYILENIVSWTRFNQDLGEDLITETNFEEEVRRKIMSLIKFYKSDKISSDLKEVYNLLFEFQEDLSSNSLQEVLLRKNQELLKYIRTLQYKSNKIHNTRINLELYVYTKYILPTIGEALRKSINDRKYVELFQKYGNEIRFFGTLDVQQWRTKLEEISDANNYDFYGLAKRINTFIKIRRSPFSNRKSVPVQIVIDSLKNPYEFSFLKDRYSAYYTIALLGNEEEKYDDDQYKEMNYPMLYENPNLIKNNFKLFVHLMIEQIEDQTEIDSQEIEYLESLESADKFLKYMLEKLEEVERENLFQLKWNLNIDRIYQKLVTNSNYNRMGIMNDEIKFYLNILKDPVRTFSIISDLYLFYMQDIQNSTQNADIFLKNPFNKESSLQKTKLKYQIVKYVSLIMHPGLVPPTKVEKCMQVALSAKVNSGCISRQVGAVVTDPEYNILATGWNNAPIPDAPCIYRNIKDLKVADSSEIFSDLELNEKNIFKRHMNCYDFSNKKDVEKILEGIPAMYCFKSVYADIKNERNPSLSRAIHAEARAFSQCSRRDTIGGCLFTTSSSCENCTMLAKEYRIKKIYYIENYPGIAKTHVNAIGKTENRAKFILFEGVIGNAYAKLYTPVLPIKDELKLRGIELLYKDPYII